MKMFRISALVGAAAAVMLLATVSAPANRLAFRNGLGTSAWRATWASPAVTGNFGTVTCPPLTLEGSFHSQTIAKVRSSLIGYVNRAASSGFCSALISVRLLTEGLPWHVRYQSFTGVLPNISSIGMQIIGYEYLVTESAFGIRCLSRSTEAQPVNMTWSREVGGRISSATIGGTITSDCGLNFTLSGTGSVPSTTITLI